MSSNNILAILQFIEVCFDMHEEQLLKLSQTRDVWIINEVKQEMKYLLSFSTCVEVSLKESSSAIQHASIQMHQGIWTLKIKSYTMHKQEICLQYYCSVYYDKSHFISIYIKLYIL